jgi:hypothetical protein
VARTRSTTEPVTYADGSTPVLPGDRVSVRLFFRRRTGEVIYVPGISKRRGTYEHNGLTWVGVSLADGWAIGSIVLPETGRLQATVRFLGRGTESAEAADALRRLTQQEAEEDAAELEVETAAAEPPRKPTALDWLAGLVAIGLHLGLVMLVIGAIIAAIVLLIRLF